MDPRTSHNPRPPEFEASMRQRSQEWFAEVSIDLRTDIDRLRLEDKRNRPMCYTGGLPMQLMFRTFPYDAFLADRAIAECYSRTSARWKINSRLWGLVSARICGRSIVDANNAWQAGDSNGEKLLAAARDKLRRQLSSIPTVRNPGLATDGSWPKWSWYIRHSSTLRQMWETSSLADRKLLSDLWGSDPWQVPLEQWAKNYQDFFRLTTLLTYCNVRRETACFASRVGLSLQGFQLVLQLTRKADLWQRLWEKLQQRADNEGRMDWEVHLVKVKRNAPAINSPVNPLLGVKNSPLFCLSQIVSG